MSTMKSHWHCTLNDAYLKLLTQMDSRLAHCKLHLQCAASLYRPGESARWGLPYAMSAQLCVTRRISQGHGGGGAPLLCFIKVTSFSTAISTFISNVVTSGPETLNCFRIILSHLTKDKWTRHDEDCLLFLRYKFVFNVFTRMQEFLLFLNSF